MTYSPSELDTYKRMTGTLGKVFNNAAYNQAPRYQQVLSKMATSFSKERWIAYLAIAYPVLTVINGFLPSLIAVFCIDKLVGGIGKKFGADPINKKAQEAMQGSIAFGHGADTYRQMMEEQPELFARNPFYSVPHEMVRVEALRKKFIKAAEERAAERAETASGLQNNVMPRMKKEA